MDALALHAQSNLQPHKKPSVRHFWVVKWAFSLTSSFWKDTISPWQLAPDPQDPLPPSPRSKAKPYHEMTAVLHSRTKAVLLLWILTARCWCLCRKTLEQERCCSNNTFIVKQRLTGSNCRQCEHLRGLCFSHRMIVWHRRYCQMIYPSGFWGCEVQAERQHAGVEAYQGA